MSKIETSQKLRTIPSAVFKFEIDNCASNNIEENDYHNLINMDLNNKIYKSMDLH